MTDEEKAKRDAVNARRRETRKKKREQERLEREVASVELRSRVFEAGTEKFKSGTFDNVGPFRAARKAYRTIRLALKDGRVTPTEAVDIGATVVALGLALAETFQKRAA